MSFHTVSWVLRHSDETLGRRLVLLSLAEFSHDDGSNAYPAIDTLAERSRLSTRQVKRCLKGMLEDGSIIATGEAEHGQTIYQIVMPEDGQNVTPSDNEGTNCPENEDRMSPNTGDKEAGKTPPTPPEDPVERLFIFWQRVMKHPRAVLDTKRRRDLTNGLKLATTEECARAILGCSRSDYHMARGQYRGGTRYDRLGLILANRDNIERFMALAPQTARLDTSGGFTSSEVDAKIREAKRNVLVAYDLAGSVEACRKGDESERWLGEHGIRVVRLPDSRPTFEDADESRT